MTAQPTPKEASVSEVNYDFQILLAYDGSEHAQAAIELLGDLNAGARSHVTALAVLPTQHIGAHEKLQTSLKQAEARLLEKGMGVTSIIKAGNPAATINAQAQEIIETQGRMDVIAIGARGLRSTLGILLGGVAQQVVEYSCCPVLVVRAPYIGVQRILFVTDGSPYSQIALEYLAPTRTRQCAKCLPLPTQAEVHIMHVLPPEIPPELAMRTWTVGPEVLYPAPPIDTEALEAEEQEQGERILGQAQAILLATGVQARPFLKRGDAATEIIAHVQEHKIDLVVCGSRGLSAVSGWLLGSVSRKLVHYTGCSVLIVKSTLV
ncbi:MAG: universal stress protein [Chloroflexota bacterium]